ncbi:MAG: porin [Lewinellaceae bacterium]|nr:porin [Lewinellaceae bacterium]
MLNRILFVALFSAASFSAIAQTQPTTVTSTSSQPSATKWYDVIKVSGYVQVRYNRLLETNPDLGCDQCDKSWGSGNSFFIRRARLKFSGHLNERVYFYVQPDFATTVSGNLHFAQLRDAYFDLGIDRKNVYRFRVGQSKVPFGWENMQSSQNRLPLDRDDALNSAAPNERDLGAFFYYTPKKVQARLNKVTKNNLRGSGDYGMFGLGLYDGQSANKPEANDNLHVVARMNYPFELKNGQIVEAGVQAYSGKFVLQSTSKGVKGTENFEYTDQRVAGNIIVFPQPFGFQAEYNVGKGPRYNPALDSIETADLKGGYVMVNYLTKVKNHVIAPFVRYQYYDGGKKHELDARSYLVKDLEIGLEWMPNKNFETNITYTISDRRYEDSILRDNHQTGSLLRIQLQINI